MTGTRGTVVHLLICAAVLVASPAAYAGGAAKLLELVPARAQAVLVTAPGSLGLLHRFLNSEPEMKRQMGAYLRREVGVDLTGVNGMYGFALDLGRDDPDIAIVLQLKSSGGKIKGKQKGRHRGVRLVRMSEPRMVAAVMPGALLMGSIKAVKAAIDRRKGKGRALGPRSKLGAVLGASPRTWASRCTCPASRSRRPARPWSGSGCAWCP